MSKHYTNYDFPYPMYCKLRVIGGLEREKLVAEQALQKVDGDMRTVFLLRIKGTNVIYGQCNFRQDETDHFDLKFSEHFEVLRDTVLSVLNSSYGVKRFIFSQPTVFREFEQIVQQQGIGASCDLV